MGSCQIAAAATMSTASHTRRNQAGPGSSVEVLQTSRPVSTSTVETINSTIVSTVIATLAAGMCSQANGLNMMAANGDR